MMMLVLPVDVGFSSNGEQVVVASRPVAAGRGGDPSSIIRIYRISGSSSSSSSIIIRGTEKLVPMQSVSVPSMQEGAGGCMRAVQWVGQYLFVIAAVAGASTAGPPTAANCSFVLSVWRVSSLDDDGDDDPAAVVPIQRIAFDLPPPIGADNNSNNNYQSSNQSNSNSNYQSNSNQSNSNSNSLFVSSSLMNPWLDCCLCVEPIKQRYLIVSSRFAHRHRITSHH